jgi:cell division protein FtsB
MTDDIDTDALVDAAEAQVITAEAVHREAVSYLEGQGVPSREGIFDRTRETVSRAADQARDRLVQLRAQRAEINAEIKLLVDEVELLERMARIRKGAK